MHEWFLAELEQSLTPAELRACGKHLATIYRTLMIDDQVWDLLFEALPPKVHSLLSKLHDQVCPRYLVNAFLMRHYPVERVIKYHFVKGYVACPDEVILFEYPVQNKRVDVARVNGQSLAYEIKTEFDHLDRLTTQVWVYATVFEYVSAIVHPSKLEEACNRLPGFCTIYAYEYLDQETCRFTMVRRGGPSTIISPSAQIAVLSSSDLAYALRTLGEGKIPKTRDERAKLLRKYPAAEINVVFKLALKEKYRKRWHFLTRHFHRLLPIDIQQFFHMPLDPSVVYGSSSSIV